VMISVENTKMTPSTTKKKKRPPQRRCGDWCEFLSSKGKLYYFQIKKGYTQWSKPESWDDNQAYEPAVKRPKTEESNIDQSPETNVKPIDSWSSTMTSLKAKIQIKSDLKKSQKKRREKVIDQLKRFESMDNETPKIHEMMALTSHQSIGVDLRELIHEKTEKKANILERDRLRRQAQIVQSHVSVLISKTKTVNAAKLMNHTQLRLDNVKESLEATSSTIKPF